jgi:hypothetical protein
MIFVQRRKAIPRSALSAFFDQHPLASLDNTTQLVVAQPLGHALEYSAVDHFVESSVRGLTDPCRSFRRIWADAGTAGSAAAFSVQTSDASALVTLASSIRGSGACAEWGPYHQQWRRGE